VTVTSLDLDERSIDRHGLGERDRGQIQQLCQLHGRGAGVAVARLGRANDQVGQIACDHGRQDLGGSERVTAAQRLVTNDDGLGRTHGECITKSGDVSGRTHRHHGHLAAAGFVDELQCHLDAVGIGLV